MISEGDNLARTIIDRDSPFYVPRTLHFLGGLVNKFPRTWLWLGRLESRVLAEQVTVQPLSRPIYISGLARSGSTLLHEVICSHPQVATHRQKDFPFISTPYWWRRATAKSRSSEAKERPHRDRMMVTADSPDSVEEMLWMAFFPNCHDPDCDNRLRADSADPAFETFYQNHLRKLLLAEGARRYAAKANYHVARLEYLLKLCPDARFVLPIRSPAAHIVSLMRQHAWFSAGHRQSPRSLAYMQRSGHYEFGLDRRPINLGDQQKTREVRSAWKSGEEVRGWALYWDMTYRYLFDLLRSQESLRKATLVVRYEEMCDRPGVVLEQVLDHCELAEKQAILDRFAPNVRRPDYYASPLTEAEQKVIHSETHVTARDWGY